MAMWRSTTLCRSTEDFADAHRAQLAGSWYRKPAGSCGGGQGGAGQVRFACERNGDALELHISDDGRGLAFAQAYEKGVANGVLTASSARRRKLVAELIFQSGLSTAAQVTQVSGRGVGMDAVRTFLEKEGGSIRIVLSKLGAGWIHPVQFIGSACRQRHFPL